MTIQWQPEFQEKEFKNPNGINPTAYKFLVELRRQFNEELVVTDDARLPGDVPTGASDTSLHYKGQAFDLRIKHFTPQQFWKFVRCCINVGEWVARGETGGMELELVWSKTDKHAHVGFFLDGRPNRFELSLE